ncbi:MAG: cytochrome c oxidase assembly protein [Chloroflexota bacterium]|nr:cytochrome c oxidase assembly protein [Chloroflexota bacterium]
MEGPELSPRLGVLAVLIGIQISYLISVGPYRNRFRAHRAVPMARQLAFAQGVLTLLLALASPLDVLADQYLFTAHMLQHLLLTLVAAPLLLAGMPDWLLRELLTALKLLGLARRLRHPLLAFFLFNLVFSLAHVPGIYELALSNPALHALEHLVFLATALVMWMPILSPLPEVPPYPPLGQLLYLFLQTLPASLVGALLSHASAPYYPTYVLAPRLVGLSPLEDQQLGGLLMWVGSGVYFLIATAVVFFIWASREEAASRRPAGGIVRGIS